MKNKTCKKKQMRALKEAGALPPTDEGDEEKEEKDVEVLSEPPEIDTSRAEDKPCISDRFFQVLQVSSFVCLAGPLALLAVFLFVSIILYLLRETSCTPLDTLRMLNDLNTSGLNEDLIFQLMFELKNCQSIRQR